MSKLDQHPVDGNVLSSNIMQLEILLNDSPGWTMSIPDLPSSVDHDKYGQHLVAEEGFSNYLVFNSSKTATFNSVLLASGDELCESLNVFIPDPFDQVPTVTEDSCCECPQDATIVRAETYSTQNNLTVLNVYFYHKE